MEPILNYSDFIEMTCKEEVGVYRNDLSRNKIEKSSAKYINQIEKPSNPFEIDYKYYEFAVSNLWNYYNCSRRNTFGDWFYLKNCPYCKNEITNLKIQNDYSDFDFKEVYVGLCKNCGWWETDEDLYFDEEENVGRSIHRRSILKEFDFYGTETPVDILQEYIVRHPNKLNDITPIKLEKLVTSVFKDFFNCEAIHVGGTNDKGIDVILINGDSQCAIQVKRRANISKTESVKNIREFLGAMVLNSYIKGIFVTTAHKFSQQAIIAADEIPNLCNIEYLNLIDAKRLIHIFQGTNKLDIPNWKKNASTRKTIIDSINYGFDKFLEKVMGHPDWKIK